MTLSEIIQICKKLGKIGNINDTTDQVTIDIVRFLNNRQARFWRKWPWDWSLVEISQSIAADSTDFTLGATVGSIYVLNIDGANDYLRPLSFKRYLQWHKRDGETTGTPTNYIKIGRDSSGNLKYRLWKTPSEAITVQGWGKVRHTVYSVSDISTNTGLAYWPVEVQDILIPGILADIYEIKNELAASQVKDALFESSIEALVEDEENQGDEELASPPPDRYIYNKRNRGGTTVI